MGFDLALLSMSDDFSLNDDQPAALQNPYPSPPSTISKSNPKIRSSRAQIPALFTNGPVKDNNPNKNPISHPFSHHRISPADSSVQFSSYNPISPPDTVLTTPVELPSCDTLSSHSHFLAGFGDSDNVVTQQPYDNDGPGSFEQGSFGSLFDEPMEDDDSTDMFSFRSWSQSIPNDEVLKPPAPSRLRSASFFFDEDSADFSSPLAQTPDLLPSLDLEDDEDDPPIMSPSSPRMRHFTELDSDCELEPVSPSLRRSYVQLNPVSFFSPPSPAPSLRSLPGADEEESEEHQHQWDGIDDASDNTDNLSELSDLDDLPSLSHSLLLDGVDPSSLVAPSSPPRSQSPEHEHEHPYYLDPTILSHSPFEPHVALQLLDLRKRSQAAEKNGKHTEQQLISAIESSQAGVGGAGMVSSRNEIRRQRKREKERSKEISALLRLKLEDGADESADETSPPTSIAKLVEGTGRGGNTSPRLPKLSPSKTVISSLPQLVARMIFRRREAGSGGKPHQHHHHVFPSSIPASEKWRARISSPLRRSMDLVDGEEDEVKDGEDDDEDFLYTMKGLPNLNLELDGDM